MKFKASLIFIALSFLYYSLSTHFVLAQSSSSASSQNASEIEKSLQERIKKTVEQNVNQITSDSKLKAFVGKLETISGNNISISTHTAIKQVTVTDKTTIVKSGSGSVEIDKLQIGDQIIAMGYTTDHQTMDEVLRIVTSTPTETTLTRKLAYVTITDLDTAKKTITLRNSLPELDNPLKITTTTELLDLNLKDLALSDVPTNQKGIALISHNSKNDTTTLLKLVVFSENIPTATPTSTPTSASKSTCGDGVCQNIVCQGTGCPKAETPETCPADCTQ